MDATAALLRRVLRRKPALKTASTNSPAAPSSSVQHRDDSLLQFGITEQLLALVRGFTVETFKNYHIPTSDVEDDGKSMAENVRKDLTDWQERHAILILSQVKEISELRYVLCPRHLKEREFWKIYFALIKDLVAPYELWAIQEAKIKIKEADDKLFRSAGNYEVEMVESKQLVKSSLLNSEDESAA